MAFDYERLIIETTDTSDGQRDRALHILARLIVPLVGHVHLAEATTSWCVACGGCSLPCPRVSRRHTPVVSGPHFVDWSRYHVAPAARRNAGLLLDPDVERVYDEFDR